MSQLKQPPIISLSDSAREYIQEFVNTQSQEGLRISIEKNGCSGFSYQVNVGESKAGDLPFMEQGIRLFIDPGCVKMVQGMKIDLAEDENRQKRLVFHNPNAEHFCGCGESFTVKEEEN